MPGLPSRLLPRWVLTAWAVALSAILLWPITRTGYLLGHDMVFTPQQPLNLASIGVSSASPRAVPLDALVALAERVVDGAVVGRIAVVLPLVVAGVGAATLLRARALSGRLAACGFAVWNPFVVERLALGQWALLWAYAALPWLVLAVAHGRGPAGWLARALALAAASVTPTGGVIATATAVTVAVSTRREPARVAGLALVLQLPWLIAALTTTAAATSDPHAVTAFAARAEHRGGVLLSLVAGGGIWNADVVPSSREGVLAWLGLGMLLAAAVIGARRLRELLGREVLRALLAVAGAGLVIALSASVPGLDDGLRWTVDHVPGAGLLRDGHKWVLVLVLVAALVVGAAVDEVASRVRATQWRAMLTVAALTAPLILLPDAAATLRRTFEPVHYPRDWTAVAGEADSGTATVLPFGSYRLFDWAPGRSVLDPAPRLLQVPTVVDDRLSVSGRLLEGEDPRAREVAEALESGADLPRRLAGAGITWVVVEHGTPGVVPDLDGLQVRHVGADVSLYRVPGPVSGADAGTARTVAVISADLLAVAVLAGLAGWAGTRWRPNRRGRGTGTNANSLL